MNFQDLYKKIAALDENLESTDTYTKKDHDTEMDETGMVSTTDQPLMDREVDECGGMMPGAMMSSSQPDSVSMTVNMSGSGKGGIRDLLNVLNNIEQGAGHDDKAMVIGMEEFANKPGEEVASLDAVTPAGDDLHSKGDEAEKVNGGGNPMQPGVSESLVAHLSNLYQEVKSR